MKKVIRKKETPIDEVIKFAYLHGITVTEARTYFLTPDLTPEKHLQNKSVNACEQRQTLEK